MSKSADRLRPQVNLQTLGLSNDESTIYLELLHGGPTTVLDLSRSINIPRTTVYRVVKNLVALQLASNKYTSAGTVIEAAHPQSLRGLIDRDKKRIERQEQVLPSLIGTLTALTGVSELDTSITHYEGIGGIEQVATNALSAKSEILCYVREDMDPFFNFGFMETVREACVAKRIKFRELVNAESCDSFTSCHAFISNCWAARSLAPEDLWIEVETLIYNDVYAIYGRHDGGFVAAELRNAKIACMQRRLFDLAWKIARPMRVLEPGGASRID